MHKIYDENDVHKVLCVMAAVIADQHYEPIYHFRMLNSNINLYPENVIMNSPVQHLMD